MKPPESQAGIYTHISQVGEGGGKAR